MPTHEERILRILSEAQEPLYASEIADRMNKDVGPKAAYTAIEVVNRLQNLGEQVVQLPEGGWTLRQR